MYHTTVVGDSINSVMLDAFRIAMESPSKYSRNGSTKSIQNLNIVLTDPRQRWLNLEGRNSNVYALIAETLWILSGSGEINPYLSFFLPRAKDFSDDGETWRGAYGPRLYTGDALSGIVEILTNDILSRRAVLSIYDNALDSPSGVRSNYDLEFTKDTPCNNWLHFYVTDNRLNLKVVSRSGDLVWGLGSINIFEWTFLQEIVYEILQKSHPTLKLGIYYHTTTDAHIYDDVNGGVNTSPQVQAVIDNYSDEDVKTGVVYPLETPFESISTVREFCYEFLQLTSSFIVSDIDDYHYEQHFRHLAKTYELKGFFLLVVSTLVTHVVLKMKERNGNLVVSVDPTMSFWQAVENSKFTKFKVVYL
jgi:hypothetical protein